MVVFPFEPVTIADGTSCKSAHGTWATCGRASTGHVRPPAPEPNVRWSSSRTCSRPRASAAATNARSAGAASIFDNIAKRAKAARSSSTGRAAANAVGIGARAPADPASDESAAALCAAAISAASRPDHRAGSASTSAEHNAHSLTSVAVNSWSNGAANASAVPPAWRRIAIELARSAALGCDDALRARELA